MALSEQEEFELLSLERDKSQFGSTPGGAATGNPSMKAQFGRRSTDVQNVDPLEKIGGAGAIGAAVGAVAPEVLTGLAGAAAAFPATARIAPLLSAGATAARSAGRATGAITGGMSGLASESAGQVAEAGGAPQVAAEGARFAAGGLSGETLNLAKNVLQKYALVPALGLMSKFKHEGAKVLLEKLNQNVSSLSQREAEHLNLLMDDLRGGAKSDQPMLDVYGGMKSGAEKIVGNADQQAAGVMSAGESKAASEASRITALSTKQVDDIMSQANSEMSKVMMDAQGGVDRRLNALPRIKAIGEKALSAAQGQRLSIGADREASDIGNDLRKIIVPRNEQAIAARRATYAATEAERDAIVAAKEQSNQFVELMPEYKALLSNLNAELQPGRHSPDVARSFETIKNGITARQTEGEPLANVSFQALDDVRRRLGETFKGKPAEGYDALSAATARKYYGQISELQKKFAGEPQSKLLSDYAEGSAGLAQFNAKTGKRVTAVDRYDDSQFATDAKSLPAQFFKSQQGVADLIELTGSKPAVVQAASEFASNQLRDKSESQVRSWMTANRDWLSALPEVRTSVENYANTLAKGESRAKYADSAYKLVQTRAGQIRNEGQTSFDAILRQAEQKAKGITGAGEAEAGRVSAGILSQADRDAGKITANAGTTADTLLGNKYEVARVKELILSGDRKAWELAAPAIANDSQAKGAIFDAVRQVIADKAASSPKAVSTIFADNVRRPLEGSGLITKLQADELAAKLAHIENMKVPDEQKLGIAKRMLLNSVNGYAATAMSRGGASLVDQIPK